MNDARQQATRSRLIAVAGDGRVEADSLEGRVAHEVGRALVDHGYRLITGGLGGVMEAACRGGRASPAWKDGAIVGVLPGHDPRAANPFVDIVIPTGLDLARNVLVAHADALIAIGGGAGTLTEIAMAWQMGRLVLAYRGPGWSGRLADQRVDGRVRVPDLPGDRAYGFSDADEAIELLRDLLPRYGFTNEGITGRR